MLRIVASSLVLVAVVIFTACTSTETRDYNHAFTPVSSPPPKLFPGNGALLASRFENLEELKSVIDIQYFGQEGEGGNADTSNCGVRLRHRCIGGEVISILESGTSQDDISAARKGGYSDAIKLVLASPKSIHYRRDLERILLLSRWKPAWFGETDVAFYNIAETMVRHIDLRDSAFLCEKDSSDKGYLNSFNHLTAQAFMTSCFSEDFADFVADLHELHNMKELTTGRFTQEQLDDPQTNPVDNYVDMINNEWGQELGKKLARKYEITRKTIWTPELLSSYVNDIQSYCSWAFQIGFKPFSPDDELMVKFSNKFNKITQEYLPD